MDAPGAPLRSSVQDLGRTSRSKVGDCVTTISRQSATVGRS
jgi:hypothetical protein